MIDHATEAESVLRALEPRHGYRSTALSYLVEWNLLVFLLGLFMWHALIPAWETLNSDFPNYYLAGLLYRRGVSLERIYEWTWFQRENDHLGVRPGLVGFAPNPPICALPIAPLTSFSPLVAKRIWLVLNVGFIALSVALLKSSTRLTWRCISVVSLSCIVPMHSNMLLGQFYLLLLLLICASYCMFCHGRQFVSGVLAGIAASLKLFPALMLLLFLWKRNWSAVAGFVCAVVLLLGLSITTLGWGVHAVFVSEVLPQMSRGDWLAPYDLWRNSFITLWSHLFLYEPQLNPSPLISSVLLYIVAMAATGTLLLFAFALASNSDKKAINSALEWAALIPLCLLLSTTTGSYHPTVLIFTAVVGIDALLARSKPNLAIVVFSTFVVACAPLPATINAHFPVRLVAIVALYLLLLYEMRKTSKLPLSPRTLFSAAAVFLILAIVNGRSQRSHAEDFSRRLRLSWPGQRASTVAPIPGGLAMIDMWPTKYAPILLRNGLVHNISLATDVLSLAGNNELSRLYVEVTGARSTIEQLQVDPVGATINPVFDGHDPAVSADGKWLTFLRDKNGMPEVWIKQTNSAALPRLVMHASYDPLEVTVSSSGDIVAAIGPSRSPHLVFVKQGTDVPKSMAIAGAVRYPSLSPDGQLVAFSRLRRGSWHLVVRDLATGVEQQLTHAPCNTTSPSWQDSRTLLYLSDCGRGVGLSAIARIAVSFSERQPDF
jgi:hypothetical protein